MRMANTTSMCRMITLIDVIYSVYCGRI